MKIDKSRAKITITLDWPEITLDNLSRVAHLWAELVQAVTKEVTGKPQSVRWILNRVEFGSPLRVEAVPETKSTKIDAATIEHIGHVVVDGMKHLETRPDAPDYFSPKSLTLARKLALHTDPQQMRRTLVSNGATSEVSVTTRTAATVDDIFGPITESYGSIEGTLEGILTHGRRRFYVYESLTGKQVRCFFDDSWSIEKVLDAFGIRVIVGGSIRSKALTGENLSIQAVTFDVFRPDNELKAPAEILKLWGARS